MQQLELSQETLQRTSTITRRASPFVKWAGGKNHLLPYLLPRVPTNLSNYYEPFLGGGALFFALFNRRPRFRSFLSDTNSELVGAYDIVKNSPRDLIEQLLRLRRLYTLSIDKRECYYNIRKWKPTNSVESAARIIFLNKTCYNGLYRVNKSGEFNVPFGHQMKSKIFDEKCISAASHALRETHSRIRSIDYRSATTNCSDGDFVYLDPPYDPSSKTSAFTDYTPKGFSEEDQDKLANWFGELVERGCTVVLSNSDTPFIRRLYGPYRKKSFLVARPISCIGAKRTGFRELVVLGVSNGWKKSSLGQ